MSIWPTEDELRERFRLLFEHNPSIVLAVDPNAHIVDANPAALRAGNYSRSDLVGRAATSFSPPGERAKMTSMLQKSLAGESAHFKSEAYGADGTIVEFFATLIPIVHQGNVAGAYAFLQNLTRRLKAERTVVSQREELVDLEHDFRSLFHQNPDAVALMDKNGIVLDVNEATLRLAGVTREQILGQRYSDLVSDMDRVRGDRFFQRALEGEAVRYELPLTTITGRSLILDVTLFPKHTRGEVGGVYAIMNDIAPAVAASRRAQLQAQRIRDLYLLAATAEYSDAHILSTLQTGCRLLGTESGAIVDLSETPRIEVRYDTIELPDNTPDALIEWGAAAALDASPVYSSGACIAAKLSGGGVTHGALLFFSSTERAQPFEDIDNDTLLLIASLVSAALERRRTRVHLRTLAYYDSLTGLPNRLYFQERLRDALADDGGITAPVAVVFFDIDRFKDVNDALGHAMGDRFLQMVARRLVDAAGNDAIVARMGGDEFIVMLRAGDRAVEEIVQQLLYEIGRPYRLGDYEQHLRASAGISIYPDDARDDQSLLKHADIAVYEAKERGGGTFLYYTPELEEPLHARLSLEAHLRRAIVQKEFYLEFQPIMDVATRRITAVEALLRWNDPVRGPIFPDTFIPAAESTGLIVEIGRWAAREAATIVAAWHKTGLAELELALNISARQFHEPDLAAQLTLPMRDCGLHPRFLKLEITESMSLANISHALETVRTLKAAGVRLSVDDFGTGHSSMSYLRRFTIDEIKIDRSFVAGIGLSPSDETIVNAIIALGRSLGIHVVAEGVESAEQFEFLRAAGCAAVQGHFISRPVSATGIEALLSRRGSLVQPG